MTAHLTVVNFVTSRKCAGWAQSIIVDGCTKRRFWLVDQKEVLHHGWVWLPWLFAVCCCAFSKQKDWITSLSFWRRQAFLPLDRNSMLVLICKRIFILLAAEHKNKLIWVTSLVLRQAASWPGQSNKQNEIPIDVGPLCSHKNAVLFNPALWHMNPG